MGGNFFFNFWFWGIFFVSFILFCFSTGCSSLKKLLQVKLVMTASAIHSSLYRTKYDSGACWRCSQYGKNIFRIFCAWLYGPACVLACLFKMSNVVCEYMLHRDWHYAKAQRLSVTISDAMTEKLKQGIIFLVLGNVRSEIALQVIGVTYFSTWIVLQWLLYC